MPIYGKLFLTLRGFTFEQTQTFHRIQSTFTSQRESIGNLNQLTQFLEDHQVQSIIVQYGDLRELRQRNPATQRIIQWIEEAARSKQYQSSPSAFARVTHFVGKEEGAIAIYQMVSGTPVGQ